MQSEVIVYIKAFEVGVNSGVYYIPKPQNSRVNKME